MASSGVFISEIVQVLVNEPFVVKERFLLTDYLGTPAAERKQLEDRYAMGAASGTEYFTKLIQEWIGRMSSSATLGQLREILKKCEFINARASLKCLGDDGEIIRHNQSSKLSTNEKAICFRVVQPTPHFVGREDEVNELKEHFMNRKSPIVVISGIGGQGKTELCRQFIKSLKNQEPCPSLVWLSGDSPTNLTSSIVQLATSLKIPTSFEGRPIPFSDLLIPISDKISDNPSSTRWLFVIDNVDEAYPEFQQIIGALVRQDAFVLITSRKIDIHSGEADQMILNVMKDDDAHNLITTCLKRPSTEEDVRDLCKKLGNHALTLRHAVSFINAQQVENRSSYGIRDYLHDFTKDRSLLNTSNFIDGYKQTVFLIVTRTLNTIHDNHGQAGSMAAELMELLSFVRPDGISVDCLNKFKQIVDDTQKLNSVERTQSTMHQVLILLKRYSLITYTDGVSLSIHRLVQKVAKCHSCNDITRVILSGMKINKTSPDELLQIIHIWEQTDAGFMTEYSNLAPLIFHRMDDHSLVQQLKSFAQKNHQRFLNLLGPEHPATLKMEDAIAYAFHVNGDNEAALPKFEQVLEKKKRVLGEEHPSTVFTSSHVASVLHELGRFEQALEWYEGVLANKITLYGSDHSESMSTRNNMAIVLESLGRKDEAEAIHDEVLEWGKGHLCHSHFSNLSTRLNMATTLYKQGRYEEARAEFESILTHKIDALGKDHASTLNAKGWLVNTLWKLGRKEEALKMNEEVLASQVEVLGTDHPDTQFTRRQITDFKNQIQ